MANRVYTDNLPVAITIDDIAPGGMFIYNEPTSPENIYMKLETPKETARAVQLKTGRTFDVSRNAKLVPIKKVTIVSD